MKIADKPRVNVSMGKWGRLREGHSVTLECAVDAKPTAVNVRWLRDGKPIPDSNRPVNNLTYMHTWCSGEEVC